MKRSRGNQIKVTGKMAQVNTAALGSVSAVVSSSLDFGSAGSCARPGTGKLRSYLNI